MSCEFPTGGWYFKIKTAHSIKEPTNIFYVERGDTLSKLESTNDFSNIAWLGTLTRNIIELKYYKY